MKKDRFLIAILAGIALLAVLAIVLFFLRQKQEDYVNDDSPEGVIHNYVLAVHKGDYDTAYSYLAEGDHKPKYADFRDAFQLRRLDISNSSLQIDRVDTQADSAFVAVTITSARNDLFDSINRSSQNALLVRQSGKWKINFMPYPYWQWGEYPPGLDKITN